MPKRVHDSGGGGVVLLDNAALINALKKRSDPDEQDASNLRSVTLAMRSTRSPLTHREQMYGPKNMALLDEDKLESALKTKAERKKAARESADRRRVARESIDKNIKTPGVFQEKRDKTVDQNRHFQQRRPTQSSKKSKDSSIYNEKNAASHKKVQREKTVPSQTIPKEKNDEGFSRNAKTKKKQVVTSSKVEDRSISKQPQAISRKSMSIKSPRKWSKRKVIKPQSETVSPKAQAQSQEETRMFLRKLAGVVRRRRLDRSVGNQELTRKPKNKSQTASTTSRDDIQKSQVVQPSRSEDDVTKVSSVVPRIIVPKPQHPTASDSIVADNAELQDASNHSVSLSSSHHTKPTSISSILYASSNHSQRTTHSMPRSSEHAYIDPSSFRSIPPSWSTRNKDKTGFTPNSFISKETMTLYTDALGGVKTVATTTKIFHDKATRDPHLKVFFKKIRWEHVRNEFIILANLLVPTKFDENIKGLLEHHCRLLEKGANMERLIEIWETAIEASWLENRMDDSRQLIVGPSRVIFNLQALERHYCMFMKQQNADAISSQQAKESKMHSNRKMRNSFFNRLQKRDG